MINIKDCPLPHYMSNQTYNVTSYNLYVLKSMVENQLIAQKSRDFVKTNIHLGNLYIYYDTETESEQIINPTYLDDHSLEGVRQVDKKHISIPYEAVDLSRCKPLDSEIGIEIEDTRTLTYRQKIAVNRRVFLGTPKTTIEGSTFIRVIGRCAKVNYKSINIRLLSGETIKIKYDHATFVYPATNAEDLLFQSVEKDKRFRPREKQRAQLVLNKYIQKCSKKSNQQTPAKLRSHLTQHGFEITLIDEVLATNQYRDK